MMDLLEMFFQNSMNLMSEATIWDSFKQTPDISKTSGGLIDGLFQYTTILNTFYFTLVVIGLLGFSYFYSHKRNKKATYTYGNTKKQALVTLVIGLAVFFSVDMMITYRSSSDMISHFWNFPKKGEDVVRVEVLAQQWMWNFRYAGRDGVFNTSDDVLSNHVLRIPKDKKVEFRISSKDVIHSFYLPNVRTKVDAIPGRITRMWFEPVVSGKFEVACAEMCGTHHYLMKGELIVMEQEDYEAWLDEAESLAESVNDIENPDIYWGWKWEE